MKKKRIIQINCLAERNRGQKKSITSEWGVADINKAFPFYFFFVDEKRVKESNLAFKM